MRSELIFRTLASDFLKSSRWPLWRLLALGSSFTNLLFLFLLLFKLLHLCFFLLREHLFNGKLWKTFFLPFFNLVEYFLSLLQLLFLLFFKHDFLLTLCYGLQSLDHLLDLDKSWELVTVDGQE